VRLADLSSLAFATLRTSTPLLFAAAGGAICERGGIVNVALEGMLLVGAFSAIAFAQLTGSTTAGVIAAVVCGIAFAAIHALATIRYAVNQIVSGVALNLLATGLTKLLMSIQFEGRTSNSGTVAAADLPHFGGIDPLVLVALAAPFLAHFLLERTSFGLRLRAAGENPAAAASLGIPVGRVRTMGVLLSGGFAALGGVYLSYDQHQFVADMTAGRGFMALAAVIFGGWRPLRALVACLIFGGLEALQIFLQTKLSADFRAWQEFVEVLPYVATLVLLATAVQRARAPAALGRA
jgi:simple sugar transport system permease protein